MIYYHLGNISWYIITMATFQYIIQYGVVSRYYITSMVTIWWTLLRYYHHGDCCYISITMVTVATLVSPWQPLCGTCNSHHRAAVVWERVLGRVFPQHPRGRSFLPRRFKTSQFRAYLLFIAFLALSNTLIFEIQTIILVLIWRIIFALGGFFLWSGGSGARPPLVIYTYTWGREWKG